MRSKTIRSEKYVLELTEEEARWLRSVMQNPLSDEAESDEFNAMRSKFFEAVQSA